ncbi:hypothetical protein JI58_03870 [Marinosulfonomonas sp. PRT-SC04]|nr:hypothetical protein JI58_03870 [Marinosulfonomonas sp. PRT-SC04]
MSALQAIQIKRRQLGIQEDDWRSLLVRTTGQRSSKGLRPKQSAAILGELDRMLGGKHVPSKGARKSLSGPYAKKIQALWISMWNLGLVQDRDDTALNAFVKKQTGLGHANWMRNPDDAVSVIEALKSWMTRERGVDWSNLKGDPDYTHLPGFKIAVAQWQLVSGLDPYVNYTLRSYAERLTEHIRLSDMKPADWIVVMNALGERIRHEVKKGGLK